MINQIQTPHRYCSPLVLLLGLLVLTACGGGGGSNSPPAPPPPPPPPTNTAPTADAGMDLSAVEKGVVSLAGSGADADGDTLSYTWIQLTGPAGIFSATDEAAPDFELPAIAVGMEETIDLQLTVSDGRGGVATDSVTITAGSTDVAVILATPSDPAMPELFRYDPQTDTLNAISPSLVAGGRVFSFKQSPDGEVVAYAAEQDTDGVRELYVATLDGSSVTKVNPPFATGLDGGVNEYEWSPDGSRLVYAADADIDEIREIYLVDRDGGSPRKLNPDISAAGVTLTEPLWSPDGRYVAYQVEDFATGRNLGVDISDTQSAAANATRVSSIPATGRVGRFAWSPDSTILTYTADQDTDDQFELYAAALDGSGQQKLNAPFVPATGQVSQFAWSPDGSRIAYAADTATVGEIELYTVAPDGTDLNRVNADLATGDAIRVFAWSPVGNTLAYLANHATDPNRGLYTANADGSNRIRASVPTVAGGIVLDFRWSPDGSRLAYAGRLDDTDTDEIYAVNPDGTAPAKLNGMLPVGGDAKIVRADQGSAWAPTSDRIAYAVSDINGALIDLFVVRADGTGVTEVTIGDGASPSFPIWSADGSAVLYRFTPTGSVPPGGVGQELFYSQVEGTDRLKIAGSVGPGGVAGRFAWSP